MFEYKQLALIYKFTLGCYNVRKRNMFRYDKLNLSFNTIETFCFGKFIYIYIEHTTKKKFIMLTEIFK